MKIVFLFVVWSFLSVFVSAEPSNKPVAVELPKLVKLIEKYKIPKPAKNAELSFVCTQSRTVLGNSSTDHDPTIYVAGLVLDSADPKKLEKADVMIGFEASIVKRSNFFSPALRKFSAAPEKPKAKGYYFDAGEISNMATAIQCERLGLYDDAKALLKLFQDAEYTDGFKSHEPSRGYLADYELFTARLIFEYYYMETLRAGADLNHCLVQLEKLRAEFPKLFKKEKMGYFAGRRDVFIDDLKTTVTTPAPAEGSIEQAILRYANLPTDYSDEGRDRKEALASRIYLRGLEAISVLVKHYDDNRITNQLNPGIMNQASFVLRVRHAVRGLLGEMTNVAYQDKANWEAWLKGQDLSDEKKFFLKMIHSKDKERPFKEMPVKILFSRYPGEIDGLIKEISEKQDEGLHEYASMITVSKLKDERKLSLLKMLYRKKKGFQRRLLLQYMVKIDESLVLEELNVLIGRIPEDVNAPYWTSEEANLTHVVARVSDMATWKNYYKKTKACKVGLRMEIMNPLNYSYLKDSNRKLRLAFLVGFLDDTEVRKVTSSKKWEGPHAGFRYDKISVQNYVAEKLNYMLALKESPTEFWKEVEWKKLRQRIKKQVAEMDLPDLN